MTNQFTQILQNLIRDVNSLLDENPQWIDDFNGYAYKINTNLAKLTIDKKWYRIQRCTELCQYSNVSSIMKSNNAIYSYLRYHGQIVANMKVGRDGRAYIQATKPYNEHNSNYFGMADRILEVGKWYEWLSPEARRFRASFKHCETSKVKSPEHQIESMLLNEFSKAGRGQGKRLCHIQPVKLNGYFFQMPSAINASKEPPTYSIGNRASIDIMARVQMKEGSRRSHLVLFEVKDQNNASEPPEKVLRQVVAYTTFIGRLLQSQSGAQWWKLFGYNTPIPSKILLIASVLMPYDEKRNCIGCEGERIQICENVEVELHTLFFDPNTQEFSGSLKNIIKN